MTKRTRKTTLKRANSANQKFDMAELLHELASSDLDVANIVRESADTLGLTEYWRELATSDTLNVEKMAKDIKI